MNLLLCGFYFQGNKGDDLLADTISAKLSKYCEIKITSTDTFDCDLLDWCDILVIGAGSHITPRGLGGFHHVKYAKEKGKKVIFYALTIEEGHPQMQEYLAMADVITVRDSVSKKIVERNNCKAFLASDPMFQEKKGSSDSRFGDGSTSPMVLKQNWQPF